MGQHLLEVPERDVQQSVDGSRYVIYRYIVSTHMPRTTDSRTRLCRHQALRAGRAAEPLHAHHPRADPRLHPMVCIRKPRPPYPGFYFHFVYCFILWKCRDDQTSNLAEGYWPSYNVPFYPRVYEAAGYVEMAQKQPVMASYQHCCRANIFRRWFKRSSLSFFLCPNCGQPIRHSHPYQTAWLFMSDRSQGPRQRHGL